jgi:hypothetical protein
MAASRLRVSRRWPGFARGAAAPFGTSFASVWS